MIRRELPNRDRSPPRKDDNLIALPMPLPSRLEVSFALRRERKVPAASQKIFESSSSSSKGSTFVQKLHMSFLNSKQKPRPPRSTLHHYLHHHDHHYHTSSRITTYDRYHFDIPAVATLSASFTRIIPILSVAVFRDYLRGTPSHARHHH